MINFVALEVIINVSYESLSLKKKLQTPWGGGGKVLLILWKIQPPEESQSGFFF